MSTPPINLGRVRKQKARAEKRARADENAARFGRSKSEREKQAAETDKARRLLDQHRLELRKGKASEPPEEQ